MKNFSATLPQLNSNDIGLNSRHSVGVLTLGRGTTSEYFHTLGYCLCTNIAFIMSVNVTTMTKSNENLAVGALIEKEQATPKLYILTIFHVPCRANSIISVCHISDAVDYETNLRKHRGLCKTEHISVFRPSAQNYLVHNNYYKDHFQYVGI